ncbi:TRAP transporter large permease subunit [Roseovarius aestuarii]|nr:TRAP transporter large permease subunit [Roseovarius aestuarii]
MTAPIILVILILFSLLASGTWIFIALIGTGVLSLELLRDLPVERLLAPNLLSSTSTSSLLVLPLFILMAEILFRSKLSQLLFEGLTPFASLFPGRLLHANVMGCTLFAATCGSSAATTLTVGRVTYNELLDRGYDKGLAMGSLAGPGTLGLLIPPSTVLIVYGVLSDTSILQLFLSGFVPGLILATLFSGYVALAAKLRPERVPEEATRYRLNDIGGGLLKVSPVVGLVFVIMGSMYLGVATPTETATFGVLGAIVISAAQKSLSWQALTEALKATAMTSSMLGLIIGAAVFLSTAFGFLGIPQSVAQYLGPIAQSPFLLIIVLLLFYILLGCFLEGISMLVMTLPVVLPLVLAAGFDPVWFGIFLVIVIEMAQITPPLGFNLFVLQNLTGEKLGRIVKSVFPFFLIMCGFVVLITIFPQIAMFGV